MTSEQNITPLEKQTPMDLECTEKGKEKGRVKGEKKKKAFLSIETLFMKLYLYIGLQGLQ